MPTLKYVGPKDITKKDASEYGDGKRARSKPESPPSVNVKDGSLAKKDLNSQATVEDDISKRVGRLSIDPLKQTKNIDTTYKNPSIITKDVTEKENIGEAPFAVLRSPTKSPPAKKHTVQPITVSLSCLSGDPFSNPFAEIANAALGIASHGYVGHENTKTKKKQIKDPNAPKRPKNSYMYFQADVHSKIKEEFPGVSFGEISKIVGQKWRNLSPEGKKKYESMASEDMARYHSEMASYWAKLKAENYW